MKITMDGKYETRDGRPVRVLCVNKNSGDPVVAIVTNRNGDEQLYTFNSEGVFTYGKNNSIHLVEWVDKSSPTKDTPIDTPVWVRDEKYEDWMPRHFARICKDEVFPFLVWADGYTSHTAYDKDYTSGFKYCTTVNPNKK